MAIEPERPIEKLLRGYARKRREAAGDPLDLHPATRRLLQGEVTRTLSKSQRKAGLFSRFGIPLLPRFAWGLSIFAVLVVTAGFWLVVANRTKSPATLAKNDAGSAILAARDRGPVPGLPPEGGVPKGNAVTAANRAGPLAGLPPEGGVPKGNAVKAANQPGPPAPAPVAAAAPAVAGNDAAASAAVAYKDLPQSPPKEAISLAAARKESVNARGIALKLPVAAEKFKVNNAATLVQRYLQVAPEKKADLVMSDKSAAVQTVLAKFQLEQTGPEVRIIDGDGSVYTGSAQMGGEASQRHSAEAEMPAPATASRAPEGRTSAPLLLDGQQQAGQTYFFRVAGTNRSLNEQVVFIGRMLAASNTQFYLQTTNAAGGLGGGGFPSAPAPLNQAPLLNSRISGTATIGESNRIEINAKSARP